MKLVQSEVDERLARQRSAVVTTGFGPKGCHANGWALYLRCVPGKAAFPGAGFWASLCGWHHDVKTSIARPSVALTSAAPGLNGSKSHWAKIPGVDPDIVLARHWLQPAMRMAVQVY